MSLRAHRPVSAGRAIRAGLVAMALAHAGCGPAGVAPRGPALPGVITTVPVGGSPVLLAISPDGERVWAAANGRIAAIDTRSNAVVATIPSDPDPTGIAVSPDGRHVYVSTLFGTRLLVVDTRTNALVQPIELVLEQLRGGFGHVALQPDGDVAWLPNEVNRVLAFASLTGAPIATTMTSIRPSDVAFAPDGRMAYVCGCDGFCRTGTVQAFDAASRRMTGTLAVGPSPFRIAVAPGGQRAYTTNLEGPSVSIIDVSGPAVVATIGVGPEPTGLAVSRDGSTVWVTSLVAGQLTAIDAGTGAVRATRPIGDAARDVVVRPDGRRAYVSTSTGVAVIDTAVFAR